MKVELRKLLATDNQQITLLLNNKKIWDNLRDIIPHPYCLKDADWFINFSNKNENTSAFAILYAGELCGIIGLNRQTDVYRLNAELGYWIGEKFWRKGIASKAIHLIAKIGFNEINLERIYAGVFDFNKPSIRVLEKNGFRQEGIHRNAIVKNNIVRDEYMFAKLKSE